MKKKYFDKESSVCRKSPFTAKAASANRRSRAISPPRSRGSASASSRLVAIRRPTRPPTCWAASRSPRSWAICESTTSRHRISRRSPARASAACSASRRAGRRRGSAARAAASSRRSTCSRISRSSRRSRRTSYSTTCSAMSSAAASPRRSARATQRMCSS